MSEEYVVKYDGSKKSYFRGWSGSRGGSRVNGSLPMFGGTKRQAKRFSSRTQAYEAINLMPFMAGTMCDVEPIPSVAPAQRRRGGRE